MRRMFLVLFVVFAVGNLGAAPPKRFAVGGGDQIYATGAKHFAISAHDGPQGASGHVVFTQQDPLFGDFTLSGHVRCVSVVGNSATIGVAIEHGTGTAEGQPGILLVVTDNDGDAPDSLTNSGYLEVDENCPAPFDATTPITSGNINIK